MNSADARPQLVIFDLDGTLVDTLDDLTIALSAVRSQQGQAAVTHDEVASWVGQGSRRLCAQAFSLADSDPMLDQVLRAFMDAYGATGHAASRLYPGVAELLEALHQAGTPMAVCTNKPERFVDELLQHLGVLRYFGFTIGGDTLAQRKPHPLPLQTVCAHFNIPTAQSLMIGDSATDLLAAHAAGMPVVLVTWGYEGPESVPEGADAPQFSEAKALLNWIMYS